MQVRLLGTVAVVDEELAVRDRALGGRRARVLIAALALADGPVPASALAAAIWGDRMPETWPVALRGTVRSVRVALSAMDGSGIVTTTPAGYCLAPGVDVDVRLAEAGVRRANALLAEGRHRAALDAIEPFTTIRGTQLLPDEDADWLAPHRAAVDAIAADALALASAAASAAGEHARAIAAARRAVSAYPLDERAHRLLIRALHQAGDRAGAVQAYERCRTTLAEELGIDPSAETVAAYLEASAGQAGSPSARVPVATTSFVGRAAETAALGAAVAQPGLITLAGPGGVGKSRLAAVVAAGTQLPGGRFWVALTGIAEDALVAASVALELDLDGSGIDPSETVATYLAPLGRALLVLDGADPVPDGTASLAAALVEACPMLTVFVTSRAPLDVDGEHLLTLDPLPNPPADDPDSVRSNPQAQLLVDRIRAAGGELTIDDTTSALVAELCRRCAGLPLALELVGAQVGEVPVGDLLDHLGIVQGDRLRSVVASSYELLAPDEAAVFRRFAVLDGPVGLRFIRAVVAGPDLAPVRVVRILRALGTRGLLSVDRSGARWRYSQDDDVHRYAGELLTERGEAPETYARLADAVRDLLPDDARQPPAPFAADVTAVLGSLRSLFGAGLSGRADRDRCLELAFRLHRYWAATSVAEGRFWLARLLAVADDSPWRRYATYALGYLGYWAGDTADALRDLRAAIELFGTDVDPFVARAYIYVAGLLDDLDRPVEALDHVRRSIIAAEPFGTDLYVAAAMGLGSVLSERGDPSAAQYAADAVARCRVDGSAEQLAALLPTAAMVCWQVGALDEARDFIAEAHPIHADHKRIARVVLLSAAAGLAYAEGDLDAAVDHGRAAEAEGTELGVEREMPLIRAVLARALLRAGRIVPAAERALAGVETAAAMSIGFPLAIGLETAALVGHATGAAGEDVATLLGTAAALRAAGDRPAPAPLRTEITALAGRTGDAVSRADAVATARLVLAAAIN